MKKEIKIIISAILAVWCFFMGFELGSYKEKKAVASNTVVTAAPTQAPDTTAAPQTTVPTTQAPTTEAPTTFPRLTTQPIRMLLQSPLHQLLLLQTHLQQQLLHPQLPLHRMLLLCQRKIYSVLLLQQSTV